MKIDTGKPYQIVYSFFQHDQLGFLIEPYAVQQNETGKLTLLHQSISLENICDFENVLEQTDYELIKLCTEITQASIYKKYNTRKLNLQEFFAKIFDATKGDKTTAEAILLQVGKIRSTILSLLRNKSNVFEMAPDGTPNGTALSFYPYEADIELHIHKLPDETIYYSKFIAADKSIIDATDGKSFIISENPVYILVKSVIYRFVHNVESSKIRPFLSKSHISIPKRLEKDWYNKFVKNALHLHSVVPNGFKINHISHIPRTILEVKPITKQQPVLQLFDTADTQELQQDEVNELKIELYFDYGGNLFFNKGQQKREVIMYEEDNAFHFTLINRNLQHESLVLKQLKDLGIAFEFGKCKLPLSEGISKLRACNEAFTEHEIEIRQSKSDKKYFLGNAEIKVEISEKTDWFDIKAKVVFGHFKISMVEIRRMILHNIREFVLPDGSIALIPDEWFEDYRDLFGICEINEQTDVAKIELTYAGILQNANQKDEDLTFSQKIRQLLKLEQLEFEAPAASLNAVLREYQQYGLNWLSTLSRFKLGALLADDMGLGKTLQTLAFLQKKKETEGRSTSLLIVPTSLIFNWVDECRKFTPDLSIHVQTGLTRFKNAASFAMFDLVITTYGLVRQDVEMLSGFEFDYIICDEAQALKNPASQIFKCMEQLKCKNRIALTGTPVENSTLDLWAIMNFVNPGLLGSKKYFKAFFQNRIERKNDEQQLAKLRKIVAPFILRRTKSEVAKDLPERVDLLLSCVMTDEQATYYQKAKETYRNLIIEHMYNRQSRQRQIILLQGLSKLRQIANHPGMVDATYKGGSGKMDDVRQKLFDILAEGHKVLIFSSFVMHLNFVKQMLEGEKIPFAIMTGDTDHREQVVKAFKHNKEIQIFLISIKTGGVGLNLPEADYVFILDPWWNPASEEQAVSRAHRIGRLNNVFVYRFISKDTIEEKIYNMQKRKQKLADELITSEESFLNALSAAELEELFN
jgi:superfamily II DNA or RNA helicase